MARLEGDLVTLDHEIEVALDGATTDELSALAEFAREWNLSSLVAANSYVRLHVADETSYAAKPRR
jgi:hypothetical protein